MNPYLKKSLELGPGALEKVVACVPESRFDHRIDKDRFTLRESVAHLVDFEPIFRARVEAAHASPGAAVESADEDQMAIDGDYGSQDVHANLKKFREERAVTAALLRSLSEADWKKTMVHSGWGTLTIEDVANFLLAHDLYHVDHAALFISS